MDVIQIRSEANFRTGVLVNGEPAYQTMIHPTIVKEQLDKVFELMRIKNISVEITE